MQLKMNKIVATKAKLSYATGKTTITKDMADCAAGFNPYGVSPKVMKCLKNNLTLSIVSEYPHGPQLHNAITKFWEPYAQIGENNIVLTDGSMGGIYLINQAFATPNATVLTIAPQFSDYTTHAKYLNIEYKPVYLKKENNYRIDIETFIDNIDDNLSLIYLDNPNNPTGQVIALSELKKVLQVSRAKDICVIIDEAYGDFMPQENSATCLLNEFDNLIVLRSFSKGLGMAGLRAGYMLAAGDLCEVLLKLSYPYVVPQLSRLAACAALEDFSFVAEARKEIAKNKKALKKTIGNHIKMAATYDACPICLLVHQDEQCDLQKMLLEKGVVSFSGACFDGLHQNSVRVRLPAKHMMQKLLSALKAVDKPSKLLSLNYIE